MQYFFSLYIHKSEIVIESSFVLEFHFLPNTTNTTFIKASDTSSFNNSNPLFFCSRTFRQVKYL